MKTEYNGYTLGTYEDIRGESLHALCNIEGTVISELSIDELTAIHILGGPILRCSDENCPCYEAGRLKGLETPREPQRSHA